MKNSSFPISLEEEGELLRSKIFLSYKIRPKETPPQMKNSPRFQEFMGDDDV